MRAILKKLNLICAALLVLFIFEINTSSGLAQNTAVQKINLIISVDWEGFSLEDHNLEAFQKFRNDYPDIKLIHFLNAAYFLNEGTDNNIVKKKMLSVIRPGDELGLHIHALETLLKASGVEYRDGETFWGREKSQPINGIRGHDIPLTLFTEDEIRKLIRTSVKILDQYGFKNLTSFRAGGWAASPQVLNALVLEGFKVDSSAVTPDIVKLVTGAESPLYKNIVNKLWNQTRFSSDTAYILKTTSGSLIEVPNNFGLADYITGKGVFKAFKSYMDQIDFTKGRPVNIHYGFHQETAAAYINEVRFAIDSIKKYMSTYQMELNSKTFLDLNSDISHDKIKSCDTLF